jgi:hypothetical protein
MLTSLAVFSADPLSSSDMDWMNSKEAGATSTRRRTNSSSGIYRRKYRHNRLKINVRSTIGRGSPRNHLSDFFRLMATKKSDPKNESGYSRAKAANVPNKIGPMGSVMIALPLSFIPLLFLDSKHFHVTSPTVNILQTQSSFTCSISAKVFTLRREKEEIVVIVRATPEKSKKNGDGHAVGMIGVNKHGELLRLYPLGFRYGEGLISKRMTYLKSRLLNLSMISGGRAGKSSVM